MLLTAAQSPEQATAPAGAPHAHAPTQHTATTKHAKAWEQAAQQVAAAVSPYKFQTGPHVTQSMWGGDPPAEAATGHETCTIISKPNIKLFLRSTGRNAGRSAASNWKNCCCQSYRLWSNLVKPSQLQYALVPLTECALLLHSSPQLLLQWLSCASLNITMSTCASP